MENYVQSVYFMTATMSTVGYGDMKARASDDPIWAREMVFMSFATVFSIILFSSVTNEIFNFKFFEQPKKRIHFKVRKIEKIMQNIFRINKD